MRISKNKPKNDTSVSRQVKANKMSSDYDEAIQYIKSAMNCLNRSAKAGDVVAKDAIVNMSVVAFDLTGNKK